MRTEYAIHEMSQDGTPPEGLALATIRSVSPGTPMAGRVEECVLWISAQGALRVDVSLEYPRVVLRMNAAETARMVDRLLLLPDTRLSGGRGGQKCYDVVTSYRLLGKTADAWLPLLYGPLTIRCVVLREVKGPEITAPGSLIRYNPFSAQFDSAFARVEAAGDGGDSAGP